MERLCRRAAARAHASAPACQLNFSGWAPSAPRPPLFRAPRAQTNRTHNPSIRAGAHAVADFSQALACLHDKFGHELQVLVETFRKRNGELRKDR